MDLRERSDPMTYESRSRALRQTATAGKWTAWLREDYSAERFLTYRQHTVIGKDGIGYWSAISHYDKDREDAAHIVFTHNTAEAVERLVEAVRAYTEFDSRVAWNRLIVALRTLDAISEEGK